ncbi:unnamed protein product [Caenorhabditis nigoni]
MTITFSQFFGKFPIENVAPGLPSGILDSEKVSDEQSGKFVNLSIDKLSSIFPSETGNERAARPVMEKRDAENFEISINLGSVEILIDHISLTYNGENFMKNAAKAIEMVLTATPKVTEFCFIKNDQNIDSIWDLVSNKIPAVNAQIKVFSVQEGLKILGWISNENLMEICLESSEKGDITDLFFEMEQFKRAEIVLIHKFGNVKLEKFDEFLDKDCFAIQVPKIEEGDALKFKKAIMDPSTRVQSCTILSVAEINMNAVGKIMETDVENRSYVTQFDAPEKNQTFNCFIESRSIRFE